VSAVSSPSIAPASAVWTCRLARSPALVERHLAVRRAVFVDEQALFDGDDRDEWDSGPRTLHAVGMASGVVGGAVRLYPLDGDALWKGDRLAVLPAYRHGSLGADLVRFAVRTAGERGGTRMVAMIQLPNVSFFELLGWRACGAVQPYHGVLHRPMDIALSAA
jgi:putative N-acetyltransferase (TIGR04045 family)